MDKIVVVRWRNVAGNNGYLQRAYACEIWLSLNAQTVMITTPECPEVLDDVILERVTAEGQLLIRNLHVAGIRKLDFGEGHMVTVSVFNQVQGVFSWEGGIHRAVIAAFRTIAARRGATVVAMECGSESIDPASYDVDADLQGSLDLPARINPADPSGGTV